MPLVCFLNKLANNHRHFERRRRRLAFEGINGAARNPQPLFDRSAGDFSPRAACFISWEPEAGIRNDGSVVGDIVEYACPLATHVCATGTSPIIIVISFPLESGREIPSRCSICWQEISHPAQLCFILREPGAAIRNDGSVGGNMIGWQKYFCGTPQHIETK